MNIEALHSTITTIIDRVPNRRLDLYKAVERLTEIYVSFLTHKEDRADEVRSILSDFTKEPEALKALQEASSHIITALGDTIRSHRTEEN